MRIGLITLFLFAVLLNTSYADDGDTLRFDYFLEMIESNHPLMKRADLLDEISQAYDLKRKGVLDSKIYSTFDSKDFKDTDYFDIWQTEAKIPTALPLDLSLGYERNNGDFLNPEKNVPNNGLIYGTLNLSILRGLLFDEQRYNMQLAELNGMKSEIDRQILKREIIYQAIATYLNWSSDQFSKDILTDYKTIITDRHNNVVQLFINGDKPAIDTIESRLNIISADKNLLENASRLTVSSQQISLFLWDNDGNPLQVRQNILAENIEIVLEKLKSFLIEQQFLFEKDPLVQKIENKIQQLSIKNRLTRENLKPRLDLKYNTIIDLGSDNISPSISANDYKYGLNIELPIRNRKTRAEIRINEAMIEQEKFSKSQYSFQLQNKYETAVINTAIQNDLIQTTQQKIESSNILYDAELLKFDLGESSIFMLNQRELKILEARLELVKSFHLYGKFLNEQYFISLGQSI